MITNSTPKKNSMLYEKGQNLIKSAYEYWQEYIKTNEPCAVVWLQDTSGHLVLFTRGEYTRDLMTVVSNVQHDEPLGRPFEED